MRLCFASLLPPVGHFQCCNQFGDAGMHSLQLIAVLYLDCIGRASARLDQGIGQFIPSNGIGTETLSRPRVTGNERLPGEQEGKAPGKVKRSVALWK